MKTLFLRLLLIASIFIVIDQLAGVVLNKIRDNSPDGRYFKTRYSLENTKDDIIILGSSRGEINYIPKLIEDSLHLSCWDASRGGQGLPYMHAIEEGILARYTPKAFILNIEADILEYPPFYQEAGFLRPFYTSHKEIQPELDKISTHERFKMFFNLYAYNSSFYYLVRPYFFHDLDGKKEDKGWKPRDGEIHDSGRPFIVIDDHNPLNEEAVREFEAITNMLEERGIQLFLVISPNYGESTIRTSTVEYLKNYSEQHDIPLFNFSSDSTFVKSPEYFIDIQHLNKIGADLFTKKLIAKIKAAYKA